MELAVEVVKLDRKEENCRRRVGVRGITNKLKVTPAILNNRVTWKVTGFKHKSGGMNQLFTSDQEKELVRHLVKHSDSGFPFTPREVRGITKDFGVSLGLREDDMEKEVLSRNWFLKLIKRNYEAVTEKKNHNNLHSTGPSVQAGMLLGKREVSSQDTSSESDETDESNSDQEEEDQQVPQGAVGRKDPEESPETG